jgi:hypothetical protein
LVGTKSKIPIYEKCPQMTFRLEIACGEQTASRTCRGKFRAVITYNLEDIRVHAGCNTVLTKDNWLCVDQVGSNGQCCKRGQKRPEDQLPVN